MSILLNVNNLEKSFAGKRLFTNLSFGINEQDRIGLVGPNGAGKSTLLKILLGQTDVDKGQVTKKRGVKIGFLGQSPVFGPDETIMNALMTINGNVSEDPQIMTKAYEWMSKLDLWQFGEDFLMAELSGGWQKRVALARELLQEPDLLFLDEPTNHLDVRSILWLEEFLQTAKFAFLVVTHDRLFLQRVTERILDLDPRNPNFLLDVNDGYLNYLDTKNQLLSAQQVQETKLKNTLRRETEWLRRGAKARQTKQKARIQAAGSLSTEVEDLTLKNRSNSVKIDFGDQTRSPKKLIETKGLKKSFQDRLLFENVNM
ncbi:MAG: ATP-binding cassette domain-containing protein, partial [Pseudobdellovibrionaceae bacterium]